MRRSTITRLKELGYSSYNEYLRSDAWLRNRARCVKKAECFICGERNLVHYHHCSYENVGNEQPGDLVALCGPHHRAVHNFAKAHRISLADAHIVFKEFFETGERPKKKRKSGKKKPQKKIQPKIVSKKLRELREENDRLHELQQKARKKRAARKNSRNRA